MALDLKRRRFTVAEYYQMALASILGEDDRVELIEGEIVHWGSMAQDSELAGRSHNPALARVACPGPVHFICRLLVRTRS